MANTLRTTSYDLADAAHLEVSLCERDGSNGLTPGFSVTGAVWENAVHDLALLANTAEQNVTSQEPSTMSSSKQPLN